MSKKIIYFCWWLVLIISCQNSQDHQTQTFDKKVSLHKNEKRTEQNLWHELSNLNQKINHLRYQGEWKKVLPFIKEALKLNPSDLRMREHLARALYFNGELKLAKEEAEDVLHSYEAWGFRRLEDREIVANAYETIADVNLIGYKKGELSSYSARFIYVIAQGYAWSFLRDMKILSEFHKSGPFAGDELSNRVKAFSIQYISKKEHIEDYLKQLHQTRRPGWKITVRPLSNINGKGINMKSFLSEAQKGNRFEGIFFLYGESETSQNLITGLLPSSWIGEKESILNVGFEKIKNESQDVIKVSYQSFRSQIDSIWGKKIEAKEERVLFCHLDRSQVRVECAGEIIRKEEKREMVAPEMKEPKWETLFEQKLEVKEEMILLKRLQGQSVDDMDEAEVDFDFQKKTLEPLISNFFLTFWQSQKPNPYCFDCESKI